MVNVLQEGSAINSRSPFAMYKILLALRNLASLTACRAGTYKALENRWEYIRWSTGLNS
jgi:hypothetical protein